MSLSFAQRIEVIHAALDRAAIPHGFGGAVALAYHVEEPRATRDIDLNISVPTDQAVAVLAAMPTGIEVGARAAVAVHRDGQIRLWWDGRSGVPVDLFFPQHRFHEFVARDTRTVPFLDSTIPIISATHLTVFKSLYNRPRDWPDIASMLEAGTVNNADALVWVSRLLGGEAAPYIRLASLIREIERGKPPGRPSGGDPRIGWRSL